MEKGDENLFGGYQSVTQPFENTGAETVANPDQEGEQSATTGEVTPEGGQVESQKEGAEGSSEGQEELKFDLEGFNKYFESEIKDESSLKEILASPSKLTTYEKQLQEKEAAYKAAMEKSTKYDELIDNLDPEKLYDPEIYAYFKMKEKFPGKDPTLMAQVRSAAFDNLSDIDKLILADKLKVKSNVSESVRQKGILQRLGIEADDLSDIDDSDRYKLASAVAEQESFFDEIRNFTPEPVKFDIAGEKEARKKQAEERKVSLRNSWEPLAKSLLKNYDKAKSFTRNEKGEFEESFSFSVDDKFRDEFYETFMDGLVQSGLEPNEENLKLAGNHLDERFKILNFNKIVNEAIKHGLSMAKDEAHQMIHNDKEQNTVTAPVLSGGDGKALTLKERVKQRLASAKK